MTSVPHPDPDTTSPARRPPAPRAPWPTRALALPAVFVLTGLFVIPLVAFLGQGFGVGGQGGTRFTLQYLAGLYSDPFMRGVIGNTLLLSLQVTCITLLISYPAALVLNSLRGTVWFVVVCVAVFSPLLTSVIVRAYGWSYVLSSGGVVNWALTGLGLIERPLPLAFNWTGTVIAMVHIEVPFMVFPLLAILMQQQPELEEASRDLGATRLQHWYRVTLPLSVPGILAGCQIVFASNISAFATPTVLGGGRVNVLPIQIYHSIVDLNWTRGAAQSLTLLAIALVMVTLFTAVSRRALRHSADGR